MSYEVKVPAVGESISEVVIAQWLKKDGDFVDADDLICEIESDKASFEIPAEQSGVLRIIAKEGDTVEIGGNIANIEEGEAKGNGKVQKVETTPAPAAPVNTSEQNSESFEIVVPTVGESISEVTIAQWLKKDGELVDGDDLICEIESDKASFEIPAEKSGQLTHHVAEGDVVAIGTKIATITGDASGNASAAQASAPKAETATKTSQPADAAPKANISPVAAKILQEAGIPLTKVNGSGPGGKITKVDALQAIITLKPLSQEAAEEGTADDDSGENDNRNTRRERMSSLRRTIARRLVTVKNETAMLTTFNEVDMSEIKKLRAQYKEMFKEKHEIGLGFMSFFTKAVCIALNDFPAVNAQIDGEQVVFHDYCDISIAVSTPRGLVVPVVRNAESISLADIEKEIRRIAIRARDGKLSIEEMTGGTFTITNGGVFGSMMSTPIINAPQSAILGMHNIVDRPVAINGEITIRPMMYLALSYDHRIIDGKESVSFLVRVKQLLEDPARMLLDI